MQLKNIFRYCLVMVCITAIAQSAGAQALKNKSKDILADKMKHREAVLAKAKSGQQQTGAANMQAPAGQPQMNRLETGNNRPANVNVPAVQETAPSSKPITPAGKAVPQRGRSVKED